MSSREILDPRHYSPRYPLRNDPFPASNRNCEGVLGPSAASSARASGSDDSLRLLRRAQRLGQYITCGLDELGPLEGGAEVGRRVEALREVSFEFQMSVQLGQVGPATQRVVKNILTEACRKLRKGAAVREVVVLADFDSRLAAVVYALEQGNSAMLAGVASLCERCGETVGQRTGCFCDLCAECRC